MKGFIEVSIVVKEQVAGVYEKETNTPVFNTRYRKRCIAIKEIIDFEDGLITTSKQVPCHHTGVQFNEVVNVLEQIRDIKSLIKSATEVDNGKI